MISRDRAGSPVFSGRETAGNADMSTATHKMGKFGNTILQEQPKKMRSTPVYMGIERIPR